MFSREFWLGDNGAAVRAVRTAAQTALAMVTVATFSPFDLGQWRNVAIVSVTAAVISLLQSLDRREALLSPSPIQPAPPALPERFDDPAAADFQPLYESTGCGGDLR